MMRHTLTSAAAALLLGLGASATANAANIVVLHGGTAETVSTTGSFGSPTVLRGTGESFSMKLKKAHEAQRHARRRDHAVSGDVLWIVDRRTGSIRACEMVVTGYVGGREISCTTR